jgi:anti-sigma B factor antagonist
MHRVSLDSSTSSVPIVQASGELDAYAADDLERALAEAGASGRVVVDFTDVSFLDSTALGIAVRGMREVDEAGGRALIVLPRSAARRIFEITTLDKVLPVATSRADALARLETDD